MIERAGIKGGWLVFVLIFLLPIVTPAQTTITDLFRGSYRVFEGQRNDIGVYRDSTVFSEEDFHPASCANAGAGLISLCIADQMGWLPPGEALRQARQTLEVMTVGTDSFSLDRNKGGMMRHFFSLEDGSQAWQSEYSSIDTAIFVCGAFFAANYFQDTEVTLWAHNLYQEIDWSACIANPQTGEIYRELDEAGLGVQGTTTVPFNEYMIVAYLAYRAENGEGGPATDLWKAHYADPVQLPKSRYNEYELLTDTPGKYLSHFIVQFCHYLCPAFTGSEAYWSYLAQACLADREWFAHVAPDAPSYVWGLGAGETPAGYQALHLDGNPFLVASPHIVAGFAMLDPGRSRTDLLAILQSGLGVYHVAGEPILWRHSLTVPDWQAPAIQGIDYFSMLCGLASLPEHCGEAFFKTYNDYRFPIHPAL